MWRTLPNNPIPDCFVQNLEAKSITSTSVTVTWTLVCASRSKVWFTKLYVEPQEFLACEDKTKRALKEEQIFTQRPGRNVITNEEVRIGNYTSQRYVYVLT